MFSYGTDLHLPHFICCIILTRLYLLWQLCSGVDENAAGACAQLVFAPIDESFADDAPLLPSGFRIIPLDAKTVSIVWTDIIDLILCVN
jgi:homeobox-leucine zipper protein